MDVDGWLSDLGLERYAQAFADNDIDPDVLPELTAEDLCELGVVSIGHRRKILRAIRELFSETDVAPPFAEPASSTPFGALDEQTSPHTSPTPSSLGAARDQGERRHLTVMFVDLVGSTELSTRLDPEDWRNFISTYQDTVAGVVTRYDGYVAQFLGDGVLCYFGWPRANEDDAESSVRAGLEAIARVRTLELPDGRQPASRIGIATGHVVVGDLIGSSGASEASAIGETPNLAARLQGLAKPDQIVVGPSTKLLLRDVFAAESLGAQTLKGIAEPVVPYRILSENLRETRFAAHHSGGLGRIVGRARELNLISKCWDQAMAGDGQMVLLSGEAGIGKSHIVQAATDDLEAAGAGKIVYQCSPYHADSAFYPIIRQMTVSAGIQPNDDNATRLEKLEKLVSVTPQNARLLAALIGIDASQKYGPLNLTPAQQRVETMEALTYRLREATKHQPVLIVFEDLHWVDPTTLELIELTLDIVRDNRVLLVATTRPSFEYDFNNHATLNRVPLSRLGEAAVSEIVSDITGGRSVPGDLSRLIAHRTDGVPLFVEELTKTILESGAVRDTGHALELTGALDTLAIPDTLQDSLMERLDRMDQVKEVAQVAACIGREFGHDLITQISPRKPDELNDALDQLARAELIYRRGIGDQVRYQFRHALVRDAAYESLLRGTRRAIHERILDALEALPDTEPEVLAVHAEAAGLTPRAIELWEAAGDTAVTRPAFDEAISHFGRAMRLLQPRVDRQDKVAMEATLPLLVKQGVASMARKGWGNDDTAGAFDRALELDAALGGTPMRLTLTYGRMATRLPRGEHAEALEQAPAFVALAEEQDTDVPAVVANRSFGITLTFTGAFNKAAPYLQRAYDMFDPARHSNLAGQWGQDLGVGSTGVISFVQMMRGQTRKGEATFAECEKLAEACGDINSIAYMHMSGTMVGVLRQDWALTERYARKMADISAEYKLGYYGQYAAMVLALVQFSRGDLSALARYQEVDAWCLAAKSTVNVGMFRVEAAWQARLQGLPEDTKDLAEKADQFITRTGEAKYLADLFRLRGAMAWDQGDQAAAEDAMRTAIERARDTGAKLLELRSAADYANFLVKTGKPDRARETIENALLGVAEQDAPAERARMAKIMQELR